MYIDEYDCHYYPTSGIIIKNINGYDTLDFLEEYIDGWNAIIRQKYLFQKDFPFRIVYHRCNDFGKAAAHYLFAQDVISKYYLPVIHITEKENESLIVEYDLFEDSETKRYKKIVDSSIWNYYVPIIKKDGKWYYELFNHVISEIASNTRRELYNLVISHEYAELNARLVAQSKLANFGTEGHKDISPFLFHSEREMLESIKKYKHKTNIKTVHNYRWRFLLLDDKGTVNMSKVNEGSFKINKLNIIAYNLCHCLGFTNNRIWYRVFNINGSETLDLKRYGKEIDFYSSTTNTSPEKLEDVEIVIDCVPDIKTAKECLKNFEYEIVLLDYLLDNINEEKDYGYKLLKELKKWKGDKDKTNKRNNSAGRREKGDYLIGPHNRFFFMFISAFTTTVQECLLEQGFNRNERGLWFIGDGACPTNTPFLFSYQLLLRMEHRLNDLKREYQGGFTTVIDVLKQIYTEKNVRENAHNHFNHVLYMRIKYHQLENDLLPNDEKALNGDKKNDGDYLMKMKSSLLVHSVFKVIHLFSGAFFEHLQHLVYLTAFGTIRQWEDLWEEYVFVRNELEEYDRLLGTKEGNTVSEAIMKYIIGLKENAY